MKNHPQNGRGYGHVTIYILSPPKISRYYSTIDTMRLSCERHQLHTGSPCNVLALGFQTVPWLGVVTVTWRL